MEKDKIEEKLKKGCGKVISLDVLNNGTQNDNIYCDGESGFCSDYPKCQNKKRQSKERKR